MRVEHRMPPKLTTVRTDTSLKEALELLRASPFRHLPVVAEEGKLAGIVTERSLKLSSPTSTTALSVFEVDYILSHTEVGQVMSSPVISVKPGLPLEEAAQVMIDHRIGCLPVVEDDKLVGIISDTDILSRLCRGTGWRAPIPTSHRHDTGGGGKLGKGDQLCRRYRRQHPFDGPLLGRQARGPRRHRARGGC